MLLRHSKKGRGIFRALFLDSVTVPRHKSESLFWSFLALQRLFVADEHHIGMHF